VKSIRVSLKERSYSILIGKDIFSRLGLLIKDRYPKPRHVLVVTQKEIAVFYRDRAEKSLACAEIEASFFVTPFSKSSEAAKSQNVYWRLIRQMAASSGKNKSLLLVALGGGVIGDLTGFAASVYRRGVPYLQVPTTLTAQVDSAIGGKTGIDLPEGKNLLGSIYQPALVLSDLSLLSSLPDRHWSDGFAEVIKYGVIKDTALFLLLEKRGKEAIRTNPGFLEDVVFRCAKIKARIVEKDEFDKKDLRIALNFGHTAGHAIEAASRFSRAYTHGEALSIGMLIACEISLRLGYLKDPHLPMRLEKTLMKFKLPLFYKNIKTEALLKSMGHDKKSTSGVNRFVLPITLGKTCLVSDVPALVIREALEKRRG